MNFIPATTAAVAIPDIRGAVTIGVRPEHLTIDTKGPLKGIVRTVENTGAVSYAYAALADETLVTVQLTPQHSLEVDSVIRLSITPGGAHFFDGKGQGLRTQR